LPPATADDRKFGILKVQRGNLDPDYLERWAAELGVAELLQRALTEA
jgi:hypothetical protein